MDEKRGMEEAVHEKKHKLSVQIEKCPVKSCSSSLGK